MKGTAAILGLSKNCKRLIQMVILLHGSTCNPEKCVLAVKPERMLVMEMAEVLWFACPKRVIGMWSDLLLGE